MSLTMEKPIAVDEAPYSKIRSQAKQLINLSHLESAVETIVSLLHKHEVLISKHSNDLKSVDVFEARMLHQAAQITELENALKKKDDDLRLMNSLYESTQRSEAIMRQKLEKVEQDMTFIKSAWDVHDREFAEMRVMVRLVDERADNNEKKVVKLFADFDDLKTTQHWLHDGQLAGRIVRLEKDMSTKVDHAKLAAELDPRDKLRKEMYEVTETSMRRIERHEQLVEKLSGELLLKSSVADLRELESKMLGKAEKEDVHEIRRAVRFVEEDHRKKIAALDEKKTDLAAYKKIEVHLTATDGEMKLIRDQSRHLQDHLSKISAALGTFASETKLQAIMKAIYELEQRNLDAELEEMNKRIDDKADKDALKYLFDVVNTYFYEEPNGMLASKVHYRCLMCNRLTANLKDSHVCRPDEPTHNTYLSSLIQKQIQKQKQKQYYSFSPGHLPESAQATRQFSILGNDGRLYKASLGLHTPNTTLPSSRPSSSMSMSSSFGTIPPIHTHNQSNTRPASAATTKTRPASVAATPTKTSRS